jgi:hypothetical protein
MSPPPIDHETLDRLARLHGFASVGKGADMELNKLLYEVGKAALDTVQLVSKTQRVQPSDFATLSKVGQLLASPVGASEEHSQRSAASRLRRQVQAGGGPVLPAAYFGGSPATGGYGSEFGQEPTVFPNPDTGVARVGQAGGVFQPSKQVPWGPPGLIDPLHCQAGGGSGRGKVGSLRPGGGWLPGGAVNRILHEYRERVNPDVRLSDTAKHYLRTMIEHNVDGIFQGKRGSAAPRRLTASLLKHAVDTWTLKVNPTPHRGPSRRAKA